MEAMRQLGNAFAGVKPLAPARGKRGSAVKSAGELAGDGADRIAVAAEIDGLDHRLLEIRGTRQTPKSGVQRVDRARRRRDRAAVAQLVTAAQGGQRRLAAEPGGAQ